jgi:hypothetical protein
VIGLIWVAILGVASAGGPEVWASQYDGRLSQAMDRDPKAAISIYETLLGGMPEEDPLRGEVLYWLGRSRWSAGDAAGAMETLTTASTYPRSRALAHALLGRLVALDTAVDSLPFAQDFRKGTVPLVRGWGRGKSTDLRAIDGPGPGGKVAAWRLSVREGEDDFLTFAMDTDARPIQRLRMSMMARTFPLHIRFVVEERSGERWTAPIQVVPTDTWTEVDLAIRRLVPAVAPAAGKHPSGRNLRWVVLRDVTAIHTEDRGENELLIDNLVLR